MTPRNSASKASYAPGFTLIELVLVIAITAIIGAMISVFFKPAIDSYFNSKRRAGLTDTADSALRRMARDIRLALPNSIRLPAGCAGFELIPASGGGRYRLKQDASGLSAPIDGSIAVSDFDVLAMSPLALVPAANDWVVIDNQNTNDVYNAVNRAQILSTSPPAAGAPGAAIAALRINLTAAFAFPTDYQGGRFSIVPNSQQAVFYLCSGCSPGGTAGQGDATGTLYRFSNYGFTAAPVCPTPIASTPIVATNVLFWASDYSPSDGATQNGFMWMQLQLQQAGEMVSLSSGAHVDNVP